MVDVVASAYFSFVSKKHNICFSRNSQLTEESVFHNATKIICVFDSWRWSAIHIIP